MFDRVEGQYTTMAADSNLSMPMPQGRSRERGVKKRVHLYLSVYFLKLVRAMEERICTDIYIYIYIYIVIHSQAVSLYQNSSVWLDA